MKKTKYSNLAALGLLIGTEWDKAKGTGACPWTSRLELEVRKAGLVAGEWWGGVGMGWMRANEKSTYNILCAKSTKLQLPTVTN